MLSLDIAPEQADKIVVAVLKDMVLSRNYDYDMPVSQILDVLRYFSTYEEFAEFAKEICNKG